LNPQAVVFFMTIAAIYHTALAMSCGGGCGLKQPTSGLNPSCLAWSECCHLALSLHSSNEPGELLQLL